MIDNNAIAVLSSDVTARNEHNGVLLYHKKTDELYFVSNLAYSLFKMLDGSQTIKELEESLGIESTPESDNFVNGQSLRGFIDNLANRELVEVWS